jgi:uncharacterized membrane protein
VVTKAGLSQNADPDTMLLIISLSWIVGGGTYAVLKDKRFRITRKKLEYSLISGILIFLIAKFLMLAVEHGEASVVIPIANMSFVIALLLSVMAKMEGLTPRKTCAIGCAVGSVFLLASV